MLLLPKSNVITDQEHCFFGLISDNSNKAWLFIDLYDVLITNYMITSLYTRQKDLKVKEVVKREYILYDKSFAFIYILLDVMW